MNPERASERRQYNAARLRFLAEHPFDQVAIAELGLDEADVIAGRGKPSRWRFSTIARSDQIHHRNKCHGARLLDERWWMATARASHELIETRKNWAREKGYLLPVQADADGAWGAGNQALPTPEFMASKVRK